MDIVKTGAWIMEYPGTHPPAHVFAVDQSGEAHFLDVSFDKIKIGRESLMDVVDRQIGLRLDRLGWFWHTVIGFVARLHSWGA